MSVFNSQPERVPAPERRPVQPGFPQVTPTSAPTADPAQRRQPSVLGKTLVFKGELSADEDLVLQGRVEGSIHHTQSLTVGVDGVVVGDIHARSILIEGTVEGDLYGLVSVLVSATAKVRGNIVAPRVGITEGANFNGSVDMSGAQPAATGRTAAALQPASELGLAEPSVDRLLSRP
ncbi:MAG: bactofilin family protein [Steroidobacteraceae bacterium]|jgi:cytoskeletal protein CcmA (bactofilin family)